ncbi:O-antigen polymerase [Paraclostridium sordellii]|uniref:O-antigen polymerase n=1 Tax=Paraclostridium sordellii TaxID=1505 RepID=UPI0005DB58B8|nr:O-antigen polymerase [Paeniclostridium sordellii]CEQ00897.1 Uncharacterised protein [[Clostridium] sordellii] [Paeniclostridium sordellii]
MENYDKNKLLKDFLKKYTVALFFIINLIFIIYFCKGKNLVGVSFLINLIIITYILNLLTNENKLRPMLATFFVFFYCYMILTPMCQVNYGMFPNTLIYDSNLVLKGNIYISIFMVMYLIAYRFKNVKPFKYCYMEKSIDDRFLKYVLILCIIITIVMSKDIINQLMNLGGSDSFGDSEASKAIIKRVLFMIPLGYVFYVISYYKNIKNKYMHIFASICLLLIYFNPLMQKRNSLGPIVLSIVFYFIIRKIGNFGYAIVSVVILLFIFPSVKIFIHDYYFYDVNTIIQRMKEFSLFKEFIWLDFDAYSNYLGTILYVKDYGLTYGKQIISTLFFFIPRGLWHGKGLSTGVLIGGYLMSNHRMWFDNLSNPIISEFYIDFGLLGMMMFSYIFGILSKKVDYSMIGNFGKILSLYISMYMIFLMRGALMPALAYLVGPLTAILLPIYIYILISKK